MKHWDGRDIDWFASHFPSCVLGGVPKGSRILSEWLNPKGSVLNVIFNATASNPRRLEGWGSEVVPKQGCLAQLEEHAGDDCPQAGHQGSLNTRGIELRTIDFKCN